MTLLEVMVVMAIVLLMFAVAIPSVMEIMKLQQRRTARDLAITYELLHDEAIMKNVTFRIAYHLDASYYEIEVGSPETLVFSDPEAREDWEDDQRDKMKRFTQREIEAGEAGQQEEQFQKVANRYQMKVELPRGTRFGGIYTPQYGEFIEPSGDEEDPEDPLIAYSYIFSNGFTERTIVQIVDADDEEYGFTVEVEPLSGRVHLHPELLELRDMEMDIPESGPELRL